MLVGAFPMEEKSVEGYGEGTNGEWGKKVSQRERAEAGKGAWAGLG